MILVLTHLEEDEQLERVIALVKEKGGHVLTLCTNTRNHLNFALQMEGSRVGIMYDGNFFIPNAIWYATHPRTDALYCLDFRFPGEHRSAMSQFITDLHYAYRTDISWFPGDLNLIGQADSKPFLLKEATLCGLVTPATTLNATLVAKQKATAEKLYKKKLGFPSVITFDKKSRIELVTTTENKLGDSNARKEIWQWQTPIESVSHVRCCIVGEKIWAVVWHRKSTISKLYDYRSQEKEEFWQHYCLPVDVEINLSRLMRHLKLQIACPEFLIKKDGQHVFIDMNPCGDWMGFFKESINAEIAESIATLLLGPV